MIGKSSKNPTAVVVLAGSLVLFFLTFLEWGSSQPSAPQQPAQQTSQQSNMQSGASTDAAHAPMKDALSRPITAGGFVDGAPIIFADITHAAGLDKFHHRMSKPEK